MLPITIILILLVMAGVIVAVNVIPTHEPEHAKFAQQFFAKLGTDSTTKRLALAAHVSAFALSIIMLAVSAYEPISLAVGTAPWNIQVLVTPLGAFMASLFTGVGLLIVWASFSMVDNDVEAARIPLYYALMCILIASLVGVVTLENLFNVFLLMEVSSFAAAGLIIIQNRPENMRAGLKYLTLSILGSAFILMGVIIFYTLTGSLSISAIYDGLVRGYTEYELRNALMFITIGVGLKSALFPLHIAAPDAYTNAPCPSSAALSGLVQKAYIFMYIKILHTAIGTEIMLSDEVMSTTLFILMLVGAAAMLAGSTLALLQPDIKRMIAYSSVAQVGYFFLGIGMATRLGLFAVFFHFLAHAVTKSMLFLCAGSVIKQTGNREISSMGGIGAQMRLTMTLFTVGALSMIGIPLLVGFNSKWFFAMGIFDSSHIWLLAVLALSSLLNGCYYLPVVVRAFFGDTGGEAVRLRSVRECAVRGLAPIVCLALLVVAFAVISGPVSYISIGIDSIW